jgi:predicted metal-dependent hydrolase
MRKFVYGTFVYEYELIRQDRKSLSLTVSPNLRISLKCPHDASDERIEIFLRKKWFWLEKKLSLFKRYQRKIYIKEYVSGEGFLYLGRQYKLLIKRANEERIILLKGQMLLRTVNKVTNTSCNKRLLDNWYQKRRFKVFQERFQIISEKFESPQNIDLIIRDMKKRWGSYTNTNKILLNPKLIHTSSNCIDYVITHELCHIKFKNHDKNFYNLLQEKYPKWEKVKNKLEMYAI